jgi:hypothetical protein
MAYSSTNHRSHIRTNPNPFADTGEVFSLHF